MLQCASDSGWYCCRATAAGQCSIYMTDNVYMFSDCQSDQEIIRLASSSQALGLEQTLDDSQSNDHK